MGATNIAIRVKGNEDAVRRAVKKQTREDQRMYGEDPYSGSFATLNGPIQFRKVVLDCLEDAADYIDNHHEKWTGPMAVRFKVYKPNKSMENLWRQLNEIQNELWKQGLTDRKRKSLEKKKAEKKAKLAEWRSKLAAKAKRTEWLVGGWAAT